MLHMVAFVLVIVGALNWGLVAFDYNLVSTLLGSWPTVEMIVYLLVGASGVYLLIGHKKSCSHCTVAKTGGAM